MFRAKDETTSGGTQPPLTTGGMNLDINAQQVIDNAAEDLQTIGAIMIAMGHPSTNIEFLPHWFVWFGRQIDIMGEQIERASKEARQ